MRQTAEASASLRAGEEAQAWAACARRQPSRLVLSGKVEAMCPRLQDEEIPPVEAKCSRPDGEMQLRAEATWRSPPELWERQKTLGRATRPQQAVAICTQLDEETQHQAEARERPRP